MDGTDSKILMIEM